MKEKIKACWHILVADEYMTFTARNHKASSCYIKNASVTLVKAAVQFISKVADTAAQYKEAISNGNDWEVRRYELAKDAMQGVLSNPSFPKYSERGYYKRNVAENAVSYADALIEELKKEEKP